MWTVYPIQHCRGAPTKQSGDRTMTSKVLPKVHTGRSTVEHCQPTAIAVFFQCWSGEAAVSEECRLRDDGPDMVVRSIKGRKSPKVNLRVCHQQEHQTVLKASIFWRFSASIIIVDSITLGCVARVFGNTWNKKIRGSAPIEFFC